MLAIYNDERWYGAHETEAMRAEVAKGPDSIVEACVTRGGKVRAKLLTNLACPWDRGEDLKKAAGGSLSGKGLRLMNTDAGEGEGGAGESDGGAASGDPDAGPTEPVLVPEGPAYNTIDYEKLRVQELGGIPFFKKLADGKYETFDCRDFVGSHGDEAGGPVEGGRQVHRPEDGRSPRLRHLEPRGAVSPRQTVRRRASRSRSSS